MTTTILLSLRRMIWTNSKEYKIVATTDDVAKTSVKDVLTFYEVQRKKLRTGKVLSTCWRTAFGNCF